MKMPSLRSSNSNKRSPTKPPTGSKNGNNAEAKVFFLKESLLHPAAESSKKEPEDLQIIDLVHPRTDSVAKFIIRQRRVYEVMEFKENHRSWFIGNSVASNGRIYLTTPVDALFLVMPLLRAQCTQKAIPLEHICVAPNDKLIDVLTEAQLDHLCDIKRAGDIVALKYNEEKTLAWLAKKCHALVPVLIKKRINCGTAATSATFVKSEKINAGDAINKDEVLRYAFNIVSEYLPEDFVDRVQAHLGIAVAAAVKSEATKSGKRKSVDDVESRRVKVKREESLSSLVDKDDGADDDGGGVEDVKVPIVKSPPQETKVTAKAKAMQKAATGTKSISSFFSKK